MGEVLGINGGGGEYFDRQEEAMGEVHDLDRLIAKEKKELEALDPKSKTYELERARAESSIKALEARLEFSRAQILEDQDKQYGAEAS